MLEQFWELLVLVPFVVGQQRPVVLPNPFGEAIAAGTSDLVQMFFRARQLELSERRLDVQQERLDEAELRRLSLERDRAFSRRMERLMVLIDRAEPGVPLGQQNPLTQDAVSQVTGLDPAENPALANLVINPFSPDDKLTQAVVEFEERLREEDPEAADLFIQERTLDRPLTEVRADSLQALRRIATHNAIEGVMGRVAAGEGSPDDRRILRNMIATETETPFQIEVIGPDGQTVTTNEQTASTLLAQWWQAEREGRARTDEFREELAVGITEAMDGLGYTVPEPLSLQIVDAIEDGDAEALEEIAARGPAALATVETLGEGRVRVAAFSDQWIRGLPRGKVRNTVRAGMGQIMAMSQLEVPREDILEIANTTSELAIKAAEEEGIDVETLPLVTNPSALMNIGMGMASGAIAGGALGTFVPGVGTSLGAAGGALLGGLGGGARESGVQMQPGQQPQQPQPQPQRARDITIQDALEAQLRRQEAGPGEAEVDEEAPTLRDFIPAIEAGEEIDLSTFDEDVQERILRDAAGAIQDGVASIAAFRNALNLSPDQVRRLRELMREEL